MNREIKKTALVTCLIVVMIGLGIVGTAKGFDFLGGIVDRIGDRAYEDNKVLIQESLEEALQVEPTLGTAAIGGICNGSESLAQMCDVNMWGLQIDSVGGSGHFVVNTTSTFQDITYGSNNSTALTFTSTTTGGLFTLQNTGATKICKRAELEITTAISANYTYSVSTSTSLTLSSGAAPTIIASTTVATTTALLNDVDNTGTNTLDSWLWENGDYIVGSFDQTNASSSDKTEYASAAGKFYIDCHTR